jgi:hypothetical protein
MASTTTQVRSVISSTMPMPVTLPISGTLRGPRSNRAMARPDAVEEARLDLAHLILNLARRGNFDPQQLAGTAVLIMASYL